MGDEETVTAVAEAVANGTTTPEQEGEDIPQKKEEEKNGVKEMEEDGKGKADEKVGSHNMDVDPEDKENKETKEEEKIEEKESKEEKEEKKEETISEAMEEEAEVDKNVDELKGEEEMVEESTQEKGSKRRGKGKTAIVKAKSNKKEMEEEQKTPVAPTIERPVRERKSVERLVTSIEKESVKEFHIEKGHGTALKDIPNVAYKLSKRKADDTLKLLHTIIFGRRGKAVQVKSNISRFSGFVWKENEEKQKIKVKEKFDKCVKEKLIEFCDVLDITIAKANTRKEDIVAKLIDFLVAPHSTTSELLAEKEQSSKGKKRKRVVKESASMFGRTPAKRSAKTSRKIEDASKERGKNNTPVTEDESDEEEEEEEEHEEEENMNGVPESSKREVPEHSESEENKDEFEDESEEDTSKNKHGSKKLSAKKESAGKAKTKKVATPKKSSPPPTKRTPVKSSSKRSKVDDSSDTSPKTFSRKKKTEVVKEKPSTPKKPASMEKTGKKVVKGKDKPKEDKLRPSDDELRNAICEILKEVDFNTATFTDILKQLAGRFNTDLTSRKSSIKLMIQDELTKLADEVDDEEEEGNAEKDETQPSGQGVEV